MKNLKFLIVLITIFNYLQLIQSNDLLELNCADDAQCTQFQHSGIKSLCEQEKCQCITSKGERVKCQLLDPKVSNIIGGPCPCNQPHSDCDDKQSICYCVEDYMPSKDKRRCIAKTVELNEKCEQDCQCQSKDFNAICNESQECKCADNYIALEGKCVSIIGNKLSPEKNYQCRQKYGANATYSNSTQYCICMPGFYASSDNSQCLKVAKYLEHCTENLQCKGTMGLGGICVENVCKCSEKYFALNTVCTAVIERGHYCRHDKDCYQHQLSETEQSMDCIYGECNCKNGFYSYNDGDCIKGSGAGIKSLIRLQYMIVFLIFAHKYFSKNLLACNSMN